MQSAGQDLLIEKGFKQYEVSAYSRPGKECRHNLNYWRFGDYLGIGAGAHSKLTQEEGRILRQSKQRHPHRYLESAGTGGWISGRQFVGRKDLPQEFMMNALRLKEGVEEDLFERCTGLSLSCIQSKLDLVRTKGLLEQTGLRATDLGYCFLNDLVGSF